MDTYTPIKQAITWGIIFSFIVWALLGMTFITVFIGSGTCGLLSGLLDQKYGTGEQ